MENGQKFFAEPPDAKAFFTKKRPLASMNNDSAAAAWLRGLQGGPDALAWLSRAARLAPNDPRIALDLARLRLAGAADAVAEAEAAFARIAARYDSAQAWLGLAVARDRLSDPAGAASALGQLLKRHCVTPDSAFLALGERIARAAGFGGFCGVDESGQQITRGAGRLLGDPPDMAALNRVEGLAVITGQSIIGWASRPAAPARPPALFLQDGAGLRRAIKFGAVLPADDDAPLLVRHSFRFLRRGLTLPFSILTNDGAHIMGSPLDPGYLAIPPVAASHRGPSVTQVVEPRPFVIIIPVYRGLVETKACLASLTADARIIVVDDATPEPALAAWLDAQAEAGNFLLLRHATNLGFAAAVNTGLKAAQGCDVLLLNSDTLVPPGAIEALREAAYAYPDIASVTPLSNEATILSYPNRRGGNKMPDRAGTIRLNKLAGRANGLKTLEIPTGIGFCMYLRFDAIDAVGGFRAEIFAQGYGEENDWCIRARHLGYRHLAALGVYVAHRGGVSFGAASRGLIARNLAILNRLYPGYHEMVMDFIAADPLLTPRAAMDALTLRHRPQHSVLLITHSHGGGVARQVAAQMEEIRDQGLRPLLLDTHFPDDPENTPYPWPVRLSAGESGATPNLVFDLLTQKPPLLKLLRSLRVTKIILHHTLGHDQAVRSLAASLGVPQDIVVHDYTSFCPRVNLLSPTTPPRYCGEPAVSGCISCVAQDRDGIFEDLPVPDLLARSAREFAAAEGVIAPSADAARRITRHFPGITPRVAPWEDDAIPVQLRRPAPGRRRIITIGGIGASKGFDLLEACARDATERGLPLDFIVAGGSADDAKLLAAGIFVTGPYAEGEAAALIAQCRPSLAFLPSIWPETWCFALSEAWRAGLYTVAFDLGAQAERIKATNRGLVLPLGLPVPRINDALLRCFA
jgi:GT2 family glycosyltransferase/glycosyltransferase involved in cell wall biosynthesis